MRTPYGFDDVWIVFQKLQWCSVAMSTVLMWLGYNGDFLIGTLTDTAAPEQHDVMFAVLGHMEEAHPAYPHWYLP